MLYVVGALALLSALGSASEEPTEEGKIGDHQRRDDNYADVPIGGEGETEADWSEPCEDKPTKQLTCRPRYATARMCDPAMNNEYNSGSFLSRCPRTCYLKGHDHGQCANGMVGGEELDEEPEYPLGEGADLGGGTPADIELDHGYFYCEDTRCLLECGDNSWTSNGRSSTNLVDGLWYPDPREMKCVEAWALVVNGLPMSSTVEVYGQGYHHKLPNTPKPRMGLGAENEDGAVIMCGGVPMEFLVFFPVPPPWQQCVRLLEDNTWEEWVYTNIGRDIHAQVSLYGRIYWIGGDRSPGTMEWIETQGENLEYTLVDTPYKFKHSSGAKISPTEFMVTGGFYNARSAFIYNVVTETWRRVADMNMCRSGHGSTYVEDEESGRKGVIVAGGYPLCDSEQLNDNVSFALGRTSEFYDLETGVWERVGDLNIAKRGMRCFTSEGHALAFGGMYKHPFVAGDPGFMDLDAYQFEHRVERFDFKTKLWTRVDTLFEIRNFVSITPIAKERFGAPCVDFDEDCKMEDANEFTCDQYHDNDFAWDMFPPLTNEGSGFFLTRCPETCYLAGYDHGQCPHGASRGAPLKLPYEGECKDAPTDWMAGHGATCADLKAELQCFKGYFWQGLCEKTCGVCQPPTMAEGVTCADQDDRKACNNLPNCAWSRKNKECSESEEIDCSTPVLSSRQSFCNNVGGCLWDWKNKKCVDKLPEPTCEDMNQKSSISRELNRALCNKKPGCQWHMAKKHCSNRNPICEDLKRKHHCINAVRCEWLGHAKEGACYSLGYPDLNVDKNKFKYKPCIERKNKGPCEFDRECIFDKDAEPKCQDNPNKPAGPPGGRGR